MLGAPADPRVSAIGLGLFSASRSSHTLLPGNDTSSNPSLFHNAHLVLRVLHRHIQQCYIFKLCQTSLRPETKVQQLPASLAPPGPTSWPRRTTLPWTS